MTQVHNDAQEIADLLNEGFYKEALDLWEEKTLQLRVYEISILKEQIHKRLNNFGKVKREVSKFLEQEKES